jgi:MraZ protein
MGDGTRMFLGDHQHTLDAKGRISLPAKFRQEMTGRLVIAKGLERCLYVYPADAYQEFLKSLMTHEDFDPKFRKVRRFFTTGAVETELDSTGRVLLPQTLRDYAGLDRDVTVAGNGSRIELWAADAWQEYSSQTTDQIEDLAKELAEAGLL